VNFLIDTHAHLDMEPICENIEKTILEAKNAGIKKIIIPGVTIGDMDRIIDLIEAHDCLYGAAGLHPSEAKSWDENSYETLKKYARHPKIVAIGEIGLDYHWDKSFNDIQIHVFKEQIRLAKELKKPIIVHDREAHQDVLNVLAETSAKEVGGIMHCFSGSSQFALQCIKLNFLIALGGPVTFKNAQKPKEVAMTVPLDHLVLETDSPYLAPQPHRGKTNYPHFVKLVAEEIAQIKGISLEEVAKTTTANVEKLFNFV
jgi:TatD DNase family protein